MVSRDPQKRSRPMAQAKPMPISATTLRAFTLMAELRAWVLPSQQFVHRPETFLRCMEKAFRLIGSPAAPIYRVLYEKHLIEIGLADCLIENVDVSVLVRHGVQPSETLVRAILDETPGRAFRRCLADLSLQTSSPVQAALRQADAQIDRSANVLPLTNEAFVGLPSPIGHSFVSTHITDHAAPALPQAMPFHDGGTVLRTLRHSESLSDLRPDPSFPAHAAVGRAAFDRLPHTRPNGLRRFSRDVGHWHAGRTETALATTAAPTGGYGPSETMALVRSLTVPRILAGAGGDVAESAIHRAEAEKAHPQTAEATELLNVALLRLAASSQRGDAGAGLAAASGLIALMGGLNAVERERAPELPPLIDYYVAGCEWSMGRLDSARSRLQNGAGSLERFGDYDKASVEQLVRANCAGRLAWLDAFCGNLRRSVRYATAVLTTRRADTDEIGVQFAHLATVLVHIERAEIEQAKQRLDHAASLSADEGGEPLLTAAKLLTQVRLAMVTDGPYAALSQLQHTASPGSNASAGWFAAQLTLATADAYLAAGEAGQAIPLLGSLPHSARDEASLLLAKAHRVTGDLPGAEAALAQTGFHSAVNGLVTEVRRWLLLAQLHAERNDIHVAGLLVDRALSAAASEALVETVREADGWLRSFVARDSRLLHRHSRFLASLGYETALRVPRRPEKGGLADALIEVPLTARETDVLSLLADYCSNEEIAADLVVSMNTVKTHIRSLFQKLSVTRRADAVRRGQALGLC